MAIIAFVAFENGIRPATCGNRIMHVMEQFALLFIGSETLRSGKSAKCSIDYFVA
jgi:hypothetical protein